jgi:hypothetical protein
MFMWCPVEWVFMQELASIVNFWAIILVLKINCENGGYI